MSTTFVFDKARHNDSMAFQPLNKHLFSFAFSTLSSVAGMTTTAGHGVNICQWRPQQLYLQIWQRPFLCMDSPLVGTSAYTKVISKDGKVSSSTGATPWIRNVSLFLSSEPSLLGDSCCGCGVTPRAPVAPVALPREASQTLHQVSLLGWT